MASLLRHHEDLPQAERSLKALSAAKAGSQLMLAVYFGDPAPIYDQLQSLPIDALCLDFTYSPSLVEIVSARGSAKPLALGLVDGRNTRLENPQTVAGQLDKIGHRLGSARAWLSPSCGFEYLPRDRAQLKLKHLQTIRQEFLGSAQ